MCSSWTSNPWIFFSRRKITKYAMRLSCFVSSRGKKKKEKGQSSHAFLSSLTSVNHAQEISFLVYFPSMLEGISLPSSLSDSSSVCLSFYFPRSVFKPTLRVCLFSADVISISIQRWRRTRKQKRGGEASRSGRYHEQRVHINETWCLAHEYSNSMGFDQTLRHFPSLSLSFSFFTHYESPYRILFCW